MYTVGMDYLPEPELTNEAIELMGETLAWAVEATHIEGLAFTGEVYRDTEDPAVFEVLGYSGLITSMVLEPPSFNLLVKEAWQQTAECNCPGADVDGIFENFELAMEEAELSKELDDFTGAETEDPHDETLLLPPNSEVTIRFDRLGAYGVKGVLKKGGLAEFMEKE